MFGLTFIETIGCRCFLKDFKIVSVLYFISMFSERIASSVFAILEGRFRTVLGRRRVFQVLTIEESRPISVPEP